MSNVMLVDKDGILIGQDDNFYEYKGNSAAHFHIQYKGTDICLDLNCSCGKSSHFDGYFAYYIQCPHCKKVWRSSVNVELTEVYKYNKDEITPVLAESDEVKQEMTDEEFIHRVVHEDR